MNRLGAIGRYLGEAGMSVRGYVNVTELVRVVVVATVAGGGILGALSAIEKDLPAIVSPDNVALMSAVVVLIEELIRRLRHGSPLVPGPQVAPGGMARTF